MASSTCQICLEIIDKEAQDNALLDKLCGKYCSALVCRQCLDRHIDVTLQQFFPGVLPRVRCPVCLVDLHSSQWQTRVSDSVQSALQTKYAELCQQACSLTAPCCHKMDYSHLPDVDLQRVPAEPLKLLPSRLMKFKQLCRQFCRHRQPPRAVLDYAFNTFGHDKAIVLLNDVTLPRILDVERRASLLLALMYLQPNTRTNCCGANFCFNCKRNEHHDKCEEEFDETTTLVRCRSCRVLLLKVEGCDSVNCVCGFNMGWGTELQLRIARKKNMLPVDIFDISLLERWFSFRQLLPSVLAELQAQISFSRCIAIVKPVLRPVLSCFIWRRRFSKMVRRMQSDLYWKAYYRWHPQEAEAVSDELSVLLSINL